MTNINASEPVSISNSLLLIEDSPVQAREIAIFLEAAGYHVVTAPDGATGLELLSWSDFELILCDLQLPGLNGFEICRKLKADPKYPPIPIILLTRWADPLNVLRGLEAGADGFISKGQRSKEILARIERVKRRFRTCQRSASEPTRVVFLDAEFELTAEREQLLDVLLSGFEDTVYLNDKFEKEIQNRLRAQAAEREKDAQIRALFEAAVDAILVIDAEGTIQSTNPAAGRTFGFRYQNDILGQNISRLLPRASDDQTPGTINDDLLHVDNLRQGVIRKRTALRLSGEDFPAELCISQIKSGESSMFTVFVRDITDRKRAEEEVANFAAELKRSNNELEQFAYLISHDLKEPLRMVTSFTKLLEEELHDALSDDGQRYIDFATEGALRMRTMIDDLLNYSRIGSHDNELVPTDLNDVMSRVLDNLAVAINESRADVRVSDLPTVTGIPSLLMRLLQNLISNAIKFVSDEDPCIQIDARHDEDHWTLTIQDNGIGIPLEHQDRVFQIFQRLHSRDEYDGTGIGLAVCRRIAERHGGKISLHSTTGQGTTFFVTLPDVDHVPPSSDTREELAPAPVS